MRTTTELTHRPKILIVEDEQGPQEALMVVLRPFFDIYSATTADEALETIKGIPHIDVVTLDLMLPGRSGLDLLQEIRRDHGLIEVIVVTGYGSLLSRIECFRHGAAGYLIKPFDLSDLLREVKIALVRKHRIEALRGFLTELRQTTNQDLTPDTAQRHLAQDPQVLAHSKAVYYYALQLAERLNLSATEREHLKLGAILHDIGLIADHNEIDTNDTIRELAAETVQQGHTQIGARMAINAQMTVPVIEIIQYHHERYDGCGYPDHLLGEDIPYLARIVSLANSIAHATSTHAIKRLSLRELQAFLKLEAGNRFDPWLTELWRPTDAEYPGDGSLGP